MNTLAKQVFLSLNNKNLIKKSYSNIVKNIKVDSDPFYIIGTTAINRPDLHLISFENYKENLIKPLLNSSNKKIIWIVNIDYVESLPSNLESTKENILNILKNEVETERLDIKFILNEKGNFNIAVRNITEKIAKQFINENFVGYIHLEDDWIFKSKISDIKLFQYNKIDLPELVDVVNFFKNPDVKVSFQPCLMKPYIWYYMFYKKLNVNDPDFKMDPEKICQVKTKEVKLYSLNIIILDMVDDIGRDYALGNNLFRGWFQIGDIKNNINLSYLDFDKLVRSIIVYLKYNTKNNITLVDCEDYFKTIFFCPKFIKYYQDYIEKNRDIYEKFCKENIRYASIQNFSSINNIYESL